jgi:hypothetical protein
MNCRSALSLTLVGLMAMALLAAPGNAQQKQAPTIQVPQPGVPEIFQLEGKFVRVAWNNEGYVILGYQLANRSIGEEWMLLDVGTTLMEHVPDYTLLRAALSLETPDGKTIPLATNEEFRAANLTMLQQRRRVQSDSINYFPPLASQPCRIGFFAELDQRARSWDQVDLDYRRACLGQLYFKVPGGIAHGQHWLNVKFAQTLLRVPFRILTDDEEKMLSKNFKDIAKQVKDSFTKKQ